jgi:hypothetical protein
MALGIGFDPRLLLTAQLQIGMGGYPGMGLPGMGMPGMMPGLGFDGFAPSAGLLEMGGLGFGGGLPLGGLGMGMANPMMGLGSFGGMAGGDIRTILMLLLALMALSGSQGMGAPFGGAGFPGAGVPGMGLPGLGGPGGIGMPGIGQQGGQIELQKGQTFTTPGGATISWKGDEVKVSEPGGGGHSHPTGGVGGVGDGARAFAAAGPGGAFAAASGPGAFAGALAGNGFALAFAGAGAIGGPCGCACGHHQGQAKPRNWRVWGDPHIDHPNGSKSDFDRKNGLFTLQDGTRVLMGADNPKGVVQRVTIFLPGTPVNFNGYDPAQTSVYQDVNGHFKSIGSAAQLMQGGFAGFPRMF